jgi:hypothetical protein
MPQKLRSVMPILIGAGGIRPTFGLYVQPITRDVGLTISDLTLALSAQNLAWGFLQPVTGA